MKEGKKFSCIVADPPWRLDMGKTRTAGNGSEWDKRKYTAIKDLEYPTMTPAEMQALDVGSVAADDSWLFLWTIQRHVENAYALARAWGYRPAELLFWVKTPRGLGLGGAFVPCVEPVLVCKRGKLKPLRRMDRNWFHLKRGKHSVKPEPFFSMVESMVPGPRLEMFARRPRPGWDVWGNEVESTITIEAKETGRTGARGK